MKADTVVTDMTNPDTGQAVAPTNERWAGLPAGEFQWSSRPVSPQTVRRICCDASLTRILTNSLSQILDVGKATPTWSAPQRKAISFRDGQCRGPRCDRPIGWTEIHHIQWYEHEGPTNLDKFVLAPPSSVHSQQRGTRSARQGPTRCVANVTT